MQSVEADEALLDYLTLFYRLGSAGKVLQKFGAIDFATTIAPGLRDILLTGKLKEAVSAPSRAGWPMTRWCWTCRRRGGSCGS